MSQRQRIITKIDANPLLSSKKNEYKQLRVAAYCRVSTDSEDQIESYKAQVAYYTDAIAKNPHWKLADIYADEGITGTLLKKRDNFNRMIRDCERGRIDYILCKSVSRFARNTVDSLKIVRKLKAKGIGVYFEEQCLDTLKVENEMFLGLHSVMAQSESENISANVRWGIQQRMKSGTYKFRYNLLGYKKGENGEPEIVEEEAVIIRRIYNMYLQGSSLIQIKNNLEENHVLTAKGTTKWSDVVVRNILTNERYCGDLMMQKTFIENPINKKVHKNRGELPKYYIQNNHAPIVDRALFQAVQSEMTRRANKQKVSEKTRTEFGKYSGKYALSEILVCGECGSAYRRKTWVKSNGEKVGVWICLNRIENGRASCPNSDTLHEKSLHEAICRGLLKAYSNFGGAMDCITASLLTAATQSSDALDLYAIEQQIKKTDQALDEIIILRERTQGDKNRYDDEIHKMSEQLIALRQQRDLVKEKLESSKTTSYEIERIKEMFEAKENFIRYRDEVVRCVVECIRAEKGGRLTIILKGGYAVEEQVVH